MSRMTMRRRLAMPPRSNINENRRAKPLAAAARGEARGDQLTAPPPRHLREESFMSSAMMMPGAGRWAPPNVVDLGGGAMPPIGCKRPTEESPEREEELAREGVLLAVSTPGGGYSVVEWAGSPLRGEKHSRPLLLRTIIDAGARHFFLATSSSSSSRVARPSFAWLLFFFSVSRQSPLSRPRALPGALTAPPPARLSLGPRTSTLSASTDENWSPQTKRVRTDAMTEPNGKLAASMESLDALSTTSSSTTPGVGASPAQVRTLFVSGLPMDAKPRELYLLFRAYPGYENSLLKVTSKNGKTASPVGFVTFASRQDADEAKRALQGVRFDPDYPQTIRLELARSNTKVQKPKQTSPPILPQSASALPAILPQATFMPQLPADHTSMLLEHLPLLQESQLSLALSAMPQTMPQAMSQAAAFQQQLQFLPGGMIPSTAALPIVHTSTAAALSHHFQHAAAAAAAAAANGGHAAAALQPCSTLFVANLGSTCAEEEIRATFKAFPGFSRLRMHNKGGSSVAFVEFQDIRQATQALVALQGAQLSSSERGGLRIEYAKNKMGDVNGGAGS
uniref:RRM domain-containing protein n=1 Tax=Steinernema glaseri TaxID=37863 RepID=A0A1I7YSD3_9BILA